jgi:hypothetical protein
VATGSLLVGIGLPWTVLAVVTAIQLGVPAEQLGRASATANTLLFAPTAIAIPIWATALSYVDHRILLATAAVVAAMVGIAARRDRGARSDDDRSIER